MLRKRNMMTTQSLELKLNSNYELEATDCPRTDDQADNESKEAMQPTNRLKVQKEDAI